MKKSYSHIPCLLVPTVIKRLLFFSSFCFLLGEFSYAQSKKAFVVNANSNNVTVIDIATNTTTNVGVGTFPVAIAITPDGSKAFVVNFTSDNVTVIDIATNSTTNVSVGDEPVAIAITPDGSKVFVVNRNGDNVTVIDIATNTTTNVGVGDEPVAIAITPDGSKAFVVNDFDGNVTVIDIATNGTTNVGVGAGPSAIAITPDGSKAFVVNRHSTNVTVIDIATNTTTNVGVGAGSNAIAITPDGSKAFVANRNSNNVTVIDIATNITTNVSDGDIPQAIAITPDGSKAFVGNFGSGNVTVIDIATNTTTNVGVGGGPTAIAITPDGSKAFVANNSDDNVTVIDIATNTTTNVGVGDGPRDIAILCPLTPEIALEGNGMNIQDGDNTPTTNDATDFGTQLASSGTVSKTFTIKNTGTGPLTLAANAVSITGSHAADFNITAQPPTTIAANDMATFTVEFDPSVSGLRSATIQITNDDADENPFDFAIQGMGLQGGITAVTDTKKMDLSGTDPCSCGDPQNVRVNGVYLFHDVVTATGTAGQTVRVIAPNDGQFLDSNGNLLSLPTAPLTETSAGVYQLDFWHASEQTTTLTLQMNGDPTTNFTFTSSRCVESVCFPIPTMSQWGLLIFGLLVLNMGVWTLYQVTLLKHKI